MQPILNVDMKELGQSVNEIKSAWNKKDYARTIDQCRKLLEYEPENLYGLIYLGRAAALTEHWPDVEKAGAALARRSPRDAFNAARMLNRAGLAVEAAKIFSEIDIRSDWFDEKIVELAWKEGISLLNAGRDAQERGDEEAAKLMWTAGARIAPRSQLLRDRVSRLALEAREHARKQSLANDPDTYMKAWRDVLRFNPSDTVAATKIARACERDSDLDAIAAWLSLLAIDPTNEVANERVRKLVERDDREDHAIRCLVEMGRDENTDPLIHEFAEKRDTKARVTLEKVMKARLKEAQTRARSVDAAAAPRQYLEAWKNVLILNSKDLGTAKKVVSGAKRLGDNSELVEGLIAHLEITPGDPVLAQKLASAAMRAGREERALEFLASRGMADLSVRQIAGLQKRVLQACKNATRALDFNHALSCFHALELADSSFPALAPLRATLSHKAASSAKAAEKQGNLGEALPLAEKVLRIAPDQPSALTIVARDLMRHKRYADVASLCQPRVKPGPEYASARKLLDQALQKMAT